MLDLNIGVMLIEVGIFLITLVLLKKFLFDPLVSFMDEREERLKKALELASSNSDDVKKLEQEIEEILASARSEARNIVSVAKEKASKEAEELISRVDKEIEEAKKELEVELKNETEAILNSLLKDRDVVKNAIENKLKVA